MLAVQHAVISLISVISPLDECEWPGSALTGAPHYARALKESSGGVTWLVKGANKERGVASAEGHH